MRDNIMLTERQINIRKNKIRKLEHVAKFRKLNLIEADDLERLKEEIEGQDHQDQHKQDQ